jgi:hypothetical protein
MAMIKFAPIVAFVAVFAASHAWAVKIHIIDRDIEFTTRLEGEVERSAKVDEHAGGVIEVAREVAVDSHFCRVIESFTPEGDGTRWDVGITSDGAAWTTPIILQAKWPDVAQWKFWTAWQDPSESFADIKQGNSNIPWNDPLQPQAFRDGTWTYGDTPPRGWWKGDIITLPMFTILQPAEDRAVSIIESPSDELLAMTLKTMADGTVSLTHLNQRLCEGRTVRFTLYLVPHAANWRGGLAWMVMKYPQYFDPPNPKVDEMAGCGAYSGDESALDDSSAARLKQMNFSVMWKLSDDYAYMGMFLPPLKDADARWQRVDDAGSPPNYKQGWTSFHRLEDHARMLKSHGFHLLSYFNASEFGKRMKDVAAPASKDDPELWRDCSAFVKATMPDAVLRSSDGKPQRAWQGGWVLDAGDRAYADFLREQARRHLRWIPDADGICIDRVDHFRGVNPHADDGISFADGRTVRSMVVSWRQFMDRLGPLMHDGGKVIFANLMNPRIDLAKHLDGIYDEFGNQPSVLNGATFICLRKPLIAWTRNQDVLSDEFFQRHLYLGAFPTAPYPTNNHCITPSAEHDRWFLDYGPLFAALRGRKWVLQPHVIEILDDARAKANLFAVDRGYAIVVAFAGDATTVRVGLHGLPDVNGNATAEAIEPGLEKPVAFAAQERRGRIVLDVPVHRGCAVVRLIPHP